MAIREKILVGLMIAALIYGAFELFAPSPDNQGRKQTAGTDIKAARQMAETINTRIEKTKLNDHQSYILAQAGRPWEHNPFYAMPRGETVSTSDSQPPGPAAELRYTGYLEIGDTRMAIINGVEYQAGQKLEQGGSVVRSIFPGRVVLESKATGEKISVPYKE